MQDQQNTAYSGTSELYAVESCLLNYNRHLIKRFSRFFVGGSSVLEFGAGVGTLAALWTEISRTKPVCVEIDLNQRNIIIQRGFQCYASLSEIGSKFDLIYTSNVLEHIENDLESLREVYRSLAPTGRVLIYVPAVAWIYSRLDRQLGHYRRYSKNEIESKLAMAGFSIEMSEFSDSLGLLAWSITKFSRRKLGAESSKLMWIYDRFLFPVSVLLDNIGFKRLFGKNLFIVAKKDVVH
jgi:SAM-dependent methyltransferase